MVKAKKELVIIGLIIVMIITLIGVSYAAFNYSKTGTKLNNRIGNSYTQHNVDKLNWNPTNTRI